VEGGQIGDGQIGGGVRRYLIGSSDPPSPTADLDKGVCALR
jgi:hypothetical protein